MIGLKRVTVKLVPYNKIWAKFFDNEKQRLIKHFGNKIIAIEHIGSTAIPGMPAKPIIDIAVGVKSIALAKKMKIAFRRLGYKHRPKKSDKSGKNQNQEELYVKGPVSRRTVYVHVSVFGQNYWNQALLFRDYLRRHHQRAYQYANIKIKLADQYAKDRPSYTKQKSEFIRKTIRLAKKEKSTT